MWDGSELAFRHLKTLGRLATCNFRMFILSLGIKSSAFDLRIYLDGNKAFQTFFNRCAIFIIIEEWVDGNLLFNKLV